LRLLSRLRKANEGLDKLQRFATGIHRDYAAVRAAFSSPWSNGPVEGQITKLKLIKRSMYGRGSFPLLRQRVLDAA
jgi:transposase